MQLILVRHARAFERDEAAWPTDARRPLTAEGRDEFARLAKRLGRLRKRVDLLESSGFVRAWQTAQVLSEQTGWVAPSRLERLEAHDSTETLEGSVAQMDALLRTIVAMQRLSAVVWVGHEPTLSQLASNLLGGSSDAVAINFKKGAAMALTIDVIDGRARGQLLWMVTPAIARPRLRSKK